MENRMLEYSGVVLGRLKFICFCNRLVFLLFRCLIVDVFPSVLVLTWICFCLIDSWLTTVHVKYCCYTKINFWLISRYLLLDKKNWPVNNNQAINSKYIKKLTTISHCTAFIKKQISYSIVSLEPPKWQL